MKNLDIIKWVNTTCSKSQYPKPSIYVKPNLEFMTYLQNNKYSGWYQIIGTGIVELDGGIFRGIAEKAAPRPILTPNDDEKTFFNPDGLYIISLDIYNYKGQMPIEQGQLKPLQGLINIKNVPKLDLNAEQEIQAIADTSLDLKNSFWLYLGIFIVSIILFVIAKNYSE